MSLTVKKEMHLNLHSSTIAFVIVYLHYHKCSKGRSCHARLVQCQICAAW